MKRYALLLCLILSVIAPLPVYAQSSGPTYQLQRATGATASGGVAHGTAYTVYGTLGQMATDTFSSTAYTGNGGIWRGISAADILKVEIAFNDTVPPVKPGDELTLAVAVTNNGVRVQQQVQITTAVPAGLTLIPASVMVDKGSVNVQDALTLTLDIGELSYEEIAVLTYRVTVDAGTEGWAIPNTATARSASFGPVSHTVVVPVFRPTRIYMPLVLRGYPPTSPPDPPLHTLDDAPDQCPGLPVLIGDRYRDDLDQSNDNDWFTFEARAGETYLLETTDLGAQADTWLSLHHAEDCGTSLAENDDIAWPANLASRLVWTVPADGVYCVLIRSWNWQVYGPETGYTLAIEITEIPPRSLQEPAPAPDVAPKAPPPPTPTPQSSGETSAVHRAPGLAAPLPQKPAPEPTPVKPVPPPTPGATSSSPQPETTQATASVTPVPLLPATGITDPYVVVAPLALLGVALIITGLISLWQAADAVVE